MIQTLKSLGFEALIGLAVGFAAAYFIGWWTLPIVCGLTSFFLKTPTGRAYAAGSAAGLLLWSLYAGWLNSLNANELSDKVAQVFKVGSGGYLLTITGVLGGLLGGFGALTGSLARQMIYPNEKLDEPTA